MAKSLTPVAVPLVLCDNVIVEKETNKITLVGIFDKLRAPFFPSPPREIHACVGLVDSLGQVPVRLACLTADMEEIYRVEAIAVFPDRLTLVNVHFRVAGLQFDKPGTYFMQVCCDHVVVAERKLIVDLS